MFSLLDLAGKDGAGQGAADIERVLAWRLRAKLLGWLDSEACVVELTARPGGHYAQTAAARQLRSASRPAPGQTSQPPQSEPPPGTAFREEKWWCAEQLRACIISAKRRCRRSCSRTQQCLGKDGAGQGAADIVASAPGVVEFRGRALARFVIWLVVAV